MTSKNLLFNANSHSNSSTNSINHNIKPKKKCLTYILDNSLESNDLTGYHSIGVNSLVYNNYDNSLISGGRDGQISVWNCNSNNGNDNKTREKYRYNSGDIYDGFNSGEKVKKFINKNLENESEILNLELSIRKGLKSEPISEEDKSFKLSKSSNLHLDWISDLSLINSSTVASCSNDLSIKLWNYNSNQITILGAHKDYIKKINFNKKFNNELISAGLDKTIKLWDLTKKCVISNYVSNDERGSIYSIDSFNNMIISGGPTNSVTLFDRRTLNKPIKHFIGHTDNIRTLILKENLFLSGSSDTSIKLWDLRTTRILRNFDMHNSPVWSLFTESTNDGHEDNDFSTFYSGDKSGLLLKTDLTASDLSLTNNSSTNSSTNNNTNQYGHNNYNYFNHKINESLGVSTIIANINSPNSDLSSINSLSGINSIVVSSDSSLVWTATSSSISKIDTNFISSWSIPKTSKLAIYQGVKLNRNLIALNNNNNNNNTNNNLTISNSNKYSFDNSNKNSIEVVRSTEDNSIKDTFDLMSQLSSDDLNQIDNALISKNQIFNDYFESSNQALDKVQNEIEKNTENNDDDNGIGNYIDNGEETNETCFINLTGGPNQEFLIVDEMNDTNIYKGVNDENDDYDDEDEKETSRMQTRSIKSNDSELDPFNNNFKESFDPFSNQKVENQDNRNENENESENEKLENFMVINKSIIINYDNIKDNLINLVPFNLKPIQNIKGKNGLIKSKILNNRRNVIAMDQTGCIYIFDILTCLLIKKIETNLSVKSIEPNETNANSNLKDDLNSMGHKLLHISDKFESICNEFQTNETLSNWCSVETKAGKLFITLEENKFTSCEIYSDEFFENYPFIKNLDTDANSPNSELIRFNIGKIVLKSFFNSFVENFLAEINNVSDAKNKSMNRLSMLSINSEIEKNSNHLPNKSINEKEKEKEMEKETKSNSKRNKFLGRFKSKDNSATTKKSSAHTTKSDLNSNTTDHSMNSIHTIESNLEFLTYLKTHSELISNSKNEPIFDYSNASNVSILINEEVSHNNLVKMSLKDLISPTNNLINHLQLQLPTWIMNCLFLNRYPINNNGNANKVSSNSNKIGFMLIPDKSNCKELKEIDNAKLTATSMIRVKKILEFVNEKLDDESQKQWKFELICKDKVLEDRMTLRTVKTRVWKRGGDIEFYYKVVSM